MADTAIDFFLLNLKQLKGHQLKDYRFPLTKRNIIVSLYEDLRFLRSFLRDSEQKRNEHTEVKDLASQIIDLALDAEDIIDSLIAAGITLTKRNIVEKSCHLFYPQRTLRDVVKEVESIKTVVRNIYEQKLYGMGVGQVEISSHGDSSRAIPPSVEEEFVVGFDQEAAEIKDQLIGSSKQQLQVISIVGMAGSCKTTLARKLYNDRFILYHFYIRAWTYVSQAYRKRDLLLGILCSVVEHTEGISRMSDEKLGEELYRRLKGRRYLVVMDDIWNIEAWNDLKRSFPNDNNGNRIMFTTRIKDVAFHAQPDCPPHSLHFLSEDESWNLLQRKVFLKESCPPALVDIGKLIAEKCRGLPLAIVVIAGLLAKTEKTQNWWNQFAESVSSYIVSDTEQQCMNTLALSYNHLPLHLKSCFLYFGAFPEDYEISVRKLTWLWIAEGFIRKIGEKDLEDVAEEYLMELIDRSLVLVAKTRARGGIRACRVHDLLRDLCLRKAKEEIFLQQIYRIHYLQSICQLIMEPSNSLRVSDLSAIRIPDFPNQILQLVLLRYLALRGKYLSLPESIYKLSNLETLIVLESIGDLIPTEIWTMKKLRHLCIAGENSVKSASLSPLILYNLKTMAQIQPLLFESGQKLNVFERTPNLQTLGFCVNLTSAGFLMLPDLSFLHRLETLKLFNKYNDGYSCKFLEGYEFPLNLKRLTLSKTALEWKEMLTIVMLPNLESLKLEFQACVGRRWDTSDGGFRQLKFLRFYCINIKQWNASSIHFPRLEHLVIQRCGNLEEIPSELGDYPHCR